MENKTVIFETYLTSEAIDECSDRVRSFLTEQKIDKRDVIRYAMTVEEILLTTMDISTEKVMVRLTTGIRFFRPFISLETDGKAHNAFLKHDENSSLLGDSLLKNLGLSPEYSYVNDKNTYFFRMKHKGINPFVSLLITLAAAIGVSFAGLLLPDDVRSTIVTYLLDPLYSVFLSVLGCIAGPMVFLSVAWGIYGIGDAATLKQVGKKMLGSYIGTVYLIVVIVGWACVPMFNLNFSGGTGSMSELSTIISMIIGIFPSNIFSPFIEGNTLQIIFLAVVIGIAMLFLGRKTTAVAAVVEQINYIVQFLIEFISKLVPYFVFVAIVQMFWSDSISVFGSVGKLFAVFIGSVIVMIICLLIFTSLRNKISPFLLFKKGLPALIIALTTASSAAAFGMNMKICQKEYGIDSSIASFGMPLGMVTFKPSTALSFLVVSLFFAEMYSINVSAGWLAILIVTVGILALATPPIPGGALTAYTVLFAQMAIPAEALAVAVACDTLLDFICTGGDQFTMPLALLNRAGKLGMVDRNKLTKAK